MRTTINIDDDVLRAARALARRDGRSMGAVVSDLARQGLNSGPPDGEVTEDDGFYGFRPLPKRGRPVSNALIDQLRADGLY